MTIQKERNWINIWYWKNESKVISIFWYWKYWDKWVWGFHTNWANKNNPLDTCFDCTLHLWYLDIWYTNWSFNSK